LIEFIETKIKNFFEKHENLKIFLLKLQFFHFIVIDKDSKEICSFFINKLLPLIKNKISNIEIQKNLFFIFKNPIIIKSRNYQKIWEECLKLFQIGLEIIMNEKFNKKKHSCNNKNFSCDFCKKKEIYKNDYGKIEIIEENLIKSYIKENSNNNLNFNIFNNITFNNNNLNLFENYNENFDKNENKIFPFEKNKNDLMDISFNENSSIIENYEKNIFYLDFNKEKNIIDNNNNNNNNNSNNNNKFVIKNEKNQKRQKIKEYQFKFTKRENIDKKVIRKFRKFIKEKFKKNSQEIVSLISNNKFWYDFISQNLMPPFVYSAEKKDFKSFNTKYMTWVFEHKFSGELYNIFISNNFENIFENFVNKFKLNTENEEYFLLKTYLNSLPNIFSFNVSNNSSFVSNSTNNISLNNNFNSNFNEFLFEKNPLKKETNVIDEEIEIEDSKDNFINEINNNNIVFRNETMNPNQPDIFKEITKIDNNDNNVNNFYYKNYSKSMAYFDNNFNLNLDDNFMNLLNNLNDDESNL